MVVSTAKPILASVPNLESTRSRPTLMGLPI